MATSPHKRIIRGGWVAVVALLTASIAFAGSSGAANVPITTSLPIDCDDPPEETIYWIESSSTAAVSLTNCTFYEIYDQDYNVIEDGSAVGVTLDLNEVYLALWVEDAEVWFGYFNPAYPETVPDGQLLTTRLFDLPFDSPAMDVGGDNSGGDGDHWLGGIDTCAIQASDPGEPSHVYSTIDIEVLIGGTYTFRGIESTPPGTYVSSLADWNELEDPFLALYSSFDPASPDDGIVGCNDDLNDLFGYDDAEMGELLPGGVLMEGHQPYFAVELEPGNYTLVLTTYINVTADEWNEEGPGDVTFEMWGPECGLDISDDPACRVVPPDPGPGPTPGPTPSPDVVVPKYTG